MCYSIIMYNACVITNITIILYLENSVSKVFIPTRKIFPKEI